VTTSPPDHSRKASFQSQRQARRLSYGMDTADLRPNASVRVY
jgi:hypothetical protein